MYGIPNCDTVKKARKWLDDHMIAYRFHNYKKEGIESQTLQRWIETHGWEAIINQRGTSWRALDVTLREQMNACHAVTIAMENPSLIRRPILEGDGRVLIGFDPAAFTTAFCTPHG